MTHLQLPGCERPYMAFTRCGETVGTARIVNDYPTCTICADIYREKREAAELVGAEA
jgi:hypothetical protein